MRATRALRRPRGWALLAVVALAAGVPLVGGTLGGAQTPVFTLTVKKVVTGVVPAGTTFTVGVTCVSADGTGGAHTADDGFPPTITFNANGDPTTTNTGSLIVGESCTANETGKGGAQSVSYGCTTTNAIEVACVSSQEVRVIPDENAGAAATITVTNAFPTPTTTTTAPPIVVAAPKFTG